MRELKFQVQMTAAVYIAGPNGEKGSVSHFRGRFGDDGTVNTGAWVWPGAGINPP